MDGLAYRQPDSNRSAGGDFDPEVDQILDLSTISVVSGHDDDDDVDAPVPIIAFGETKIKSPVQEVSAGKPFGLLCSVVCDQALQMVELGSFLAHRLILRKLTFSLPASSINCFCSVWMQLV